YIRMKGPQRPSGYVCMHPSMPSFPRTPNDVKEQLRKLEAESEWEKRQELNLHKLAKKMTYLTDQPTSVKELAEVVRRRAQRHGSQESDPVEPVRPGVVHLDVPGRIRNPRVSLVRAVWTYLHEN